jgi:cyclopropane fatty-acyl-phospholipid synthase-like methyltransferase
MYAAEKYGAKAVGVELDKDLARESQEEIRRRKLEDQVKVIQGDLFETDISSATVVAVYLLQAANRTLSPIMEKDLRPGTRVVAHDIRIPDWKPVEELSIDSGGVQHFIYLYRVPESFRK